jgi:O-acetyl-ADP-ribose deacetylase (regulator of RNase III)
MPSIQYIQQDITEVSEGIIAHQVNCQATMGAGLALQIAQKWPKAEKDYLDYCSRFEYSWQTLGRVCLSEVGPKLNVAHLFGQYSYGREGKHTEYLALYEALRTLSDKLSYCADTIYIPYKMGAGLGGGNWRIIEQIIAKALKHNNVKVCTL